MEKLGIQQLAIESFLKEQANIKPFNVKDIENHVIIDKERNHFQLLSIGWLDGRQSFKVLFHIDIKGEKVWIQKNETEVQIADRLIELGIEREDIILGFQPPHARPYTGFAVA